MRAESAFQKWQSIPMLLLSLKRFFFLNMTFQNKYSKYKTVFCPKNYLYLKKKHINKTKTMTKISFWNQRRYSRGQKPMPEFSIGKHDQQEFPCSLETRVWGNDLIKNAKLAKLAQLQNRSLEAANPPSKNDSLNTNRTNYPNLYDLLSIISHRPLSLRSKAEG